MCSIQDRQIKCFSLSQRSTDGGQTKEKEISGKPSSRRQVGKRECKCLKIFLLFSSLRRGKIAAASQLRACTKDCTTTHILLTFSFYTVGQGSN